MLSFFLSKHMISAIMRDKAAVVTVKERRFCR